MVHWGLPSIPAYAPAAGSPADILANHDWRHYFLNNPYAEWYQNSLRLPDSPARAYHRKRFNRFFAYQRLAGRFNEEISSWDPHEWADLFREAGARYVVMVSKHHDGFLLWPSERAPSVEGYVAGRDIVGELADAVRARSLHYGVYYSGLLDWTVQKEPVAEFADLLTVPTDAAYAQYVHDHFTELIRRYRPDILWNDIGLPAELSRRDLFAHYRREVPDGVTNDRWNQTSPLLRRLLERPGFRRRVAKAARRMVLSGRPAGRHGDVSTVEYPPRTTLRTRPWEAVRSIGSSFCWNEQEPEDAYLTGDQLIAILADVVSKNGNLLLNVGPKPDGTIPREQRAPLLELAGWLRVNGSAIYGTRPWHVAQSTAEGGVPIRFTTRPDTLFAIVLGRPERLSLVIPGLDLQRIPRRDGGSPAGDTFSAAILGIDEPIEWRHTNGAVEVYLPGSLVASGPFVVAFRRHRDGEEPEPISLFTDIV